MHIQISGVIELGQIRKCEGLHDFALPYSYSYSKSEN